MLKTHGGFDKFLFLIQVDGGTNTFRGKDRGRIVGKGYIKLGELIIEDVVLVKGLRHNVIDISQLCNKGYEIYFKDGERMGKSKDQSQVFTGKRHGNIFSILIVYCLLYNHYQRETRGATQKTWTR